MPEGGDQIPLESAQADELALELLPPPLTRCEIRCNEVGRRPGVRLAEPRKIGRRLDAAVQLRSWRTSYAEVVGPDHVGHGRSPGESALVEEAYLRTLSRFPSPEESKISIEAIETAADPVDGLRDVLVFLEYTYDYR